jgi:hypothetical protein
LDIRLAAACAAVRTSHFDELLWPQVETLLRMGVPQSTIRDGVMNSTLLHTAALYGHVAVARLLLRNGADLDAVDTQLATPLMWAASWGHAELVGLLLDAGASPELRDSSGECAAEKARDVGQPALEHQLREAALAADAEISGSSLQRRRPCTVDAATSPTPPSADGGGVGEPGRESLRAASLMLLPADAGRREWGHTEASAEQAQSSERAAPITCVASSD